LTSSTAAAWAGLARKLMYKTSKQCKVLWAKKQLQ